MISTKLTKLIIVSLIAAIMALSIVGCVSQYKYFPPEPQWEGNAKVLLWTNDTYVVTESFVNNYTYYGLYFRSINDWRKNNGVP